MNSRGMGVVSYSLIQSEGVIQLETCGKDHYLLYIKDAQERETLIGLSRDTARHLAQDILHHIGIMEDKERKEAQE